MKTLTEQTLQRELFVFNVTRVTGAFEIEKGEILERKEKCACEGKKRKGRPRALLCHARATTVKLCLFVPTLGAGYAVCIKFNLVRLAHAQ